MAFRRHRCFATAAALAATAWTVLAAEPTAFGPTRHAIDIQRVNMYRAMQMPEGGHEKEPLANNNLADIVGVFRYLHDEVVVEHALATPLRTSRKSGIDAIARYRMELRNPSEILEHVQGERQLIPGFGPYGAFDHGVCTDTDTLTAISEYGDVIGARPGAHRTDHAIKFNRDWYWYSVTGSCPNLPWTCIKPYPNCTEDPPDHEVESCSASGGGCAGKSDEGAVQCFQDRNFTNLTNGDLRRSCCLRYAGSDRPISGGLCNDSTPHPTGERSCVYKYEPLSRESFVKLDELAGIVMMKCVKADGTFYPCKDWYDWRMNCHDPKGRYKKKFECDNCDAATPADHWAPRLVKTSYCVEYDIHHFCHDSGPQLCEDSRCKALAPESREVGLKFWRGKCDVRANQRRAESVTRVMLENSGTHLLVDDGNFADGPNCSASPMCKPTRAGGIYCTRFFAEICSRCFLPGTLQVLPGDKHLPACPYNVLSEVGNVLAPWTACKSSRPRDICCLYSMPNVALDAQHATLDKCDVNEEDPPLDVDGFLVNARKQDTNAMFDFFQSWIRFHGGNLTGLTTKKEIMLKRAAYWAWSTQPPVSEAEAVSTWQAVQEEIAAIGIAGLKPPVTTETPTAAPSAAPSLAPTAPVTQAPTYSPTPSPTTQAPTPQPVQPTSQPTLATTLPFYGGETVDWLWVPALLLASVTIMLGLAAILHRRRAEQAELLSQLSGRPSFDGQQLSEMRA